MSRSTLYKIIAGVVAIDVFTIVGTWLLGGFAGLSAGGAGALIAGVTASFALGIGLMVLVFHSSRSGVDDSTHRATEDRPEKDR